MKNECAYFNEMKCRSCSLLDQGMEQAIVKKVDTALNQMGDLQEVEIREAVFLDRPFLSRNKARLVVSGTIERPILGIPSPENKFKINELMNCPLHLEGINNVLPTLVKVIQDYKITPYDIGTSKGELKFIIIYKSESTGECYYRFVLRSKESLDRLKQALPFLLKENPMLKVVSCSLQPKHMATHEGNEEIFLTEGKTVLNIMNGVTLPITPQSFFQVTSRIAEKLYKEVSDNIKSNTHVLDLFCGVGGFSLNVAHKSSTVTGVELSESAIECAKKASEINGASNVEFYAEDAFLFLTKLKKTFDTVIVNPPRRGLGESVVGLIEQLSPDSLFYSSCNPETFAKDRELLKNYRLKWIRPFDMFPYSDHLEVLGEFERIS